MVIAFHSDPEMIRRVGVPQHRPALGLLLVLVVLDVELQAPRKVSVHTYDHERPQIFSYFQRLRLAILTSEGSGHS